MKIKQKALTFEDVLLIPAYSEILPQEVNTQTLLSKNISLNVPLVSAAMDTVTECRTAIAMARLGGIGIIHKNMDIDSQVEQIKRVKKSESGVIIDPIYIRANLLMQNQLQIIIKSLVCLLLMNMANSLVFSLIVICALNKI